jgi:hypothetical protein
VLFLRPDFLVAVNVSKRRCNLLDFGGWDAEALEVASPLAHDAPAHVSRWCPASVRRGWTHGCRALVVLSELEFFEFSDAHVTHALGKHPLDR